jgi:hypothetical protein
VVRKRTQGPTERELESWAAKQARDAAVPEPVFEGDITSQYEGEQLELARSAAFDENPKARVVNLERKVDQLHAQLLARADRSVEFGRGLAMKVIGGILGALAIIAAALAAGYSAGAHH